MSSRHFATRLLDWHERHGRHDLPWQTEPTPYRVWISEIMLQQTQVATVIPYFERFMARLPDLGSLAAADLDTVLGLWSGLGYYARARNLHRAARLVWDEHDGALPEDIEALAALPGIGRSTAGAILALACGQRHPILDGNVKRVLARYHAVSGWPGRSVVARQLWALADVHTPAAAVQRYTQAIMDLGAAVCTRARPACERCPLTAGCAAHRSGTEVRYPTPRPRRALPVRTARLVLVGREDGAILLQRRAPAGIWGGLWSAPECPADQTVEEWCRQALGWSVEPVQSLPALRHTFSHFHLDITPLLVQAVTRIDKAEDLTDQVWFQPRKPASLGIPAPVERLLIEAYRLLRGEVNGSNGELRQAGP